MYIDQNFQVSGPGHWPSQHLKISSGASCQKNFYEATISESSQIN